MVTKGVMVEDGENREKGCDRIKGRMVSAASNRVKGRKKFKVILHTLCDKKCFVQCSMLLFDKAK